MKRSNEEFKTRVIMRRGQIINRSRVDRCIISKRQNQIKDPLTRNTREYRYRALHLTNLCSGVLATPGIDPPRDRRPICHVDRIAYYTRISTCYAGIVIKYRQSAFALRILPYWATRINARISANSYWLASSN